MPSIAFVKFSAAVEGARVLRGFHGSSSSVTTNQALVDEACLRASVAQAVGCWEGYFEAVLREFVSKVRVQAHRRNWTLIAQFEMMVDKKASALNTPNWDQTRDMLIEVAGMDPYSSWVWTPRFANPSDTKNFFDGIMTVRHSFAHGFPVPPSIPGLISPGILDTTYVDLAIDCLTFFAITSDALLEHELKHRHNCLAGWN